MKILIADDEQVFCRLLKHCLEVRGYAVWWATSGEQALRVAEQENPRLVTLDIRMPGMDGYELLEKLKQRDGGIRVIVITAHDEAGLEQKLSNAGAHALIRKPLLIEDLLRVIDTLRGNGSHGA